MIRDAVVLWCCGAVVSSIYIPGPAGQAEAFEVKAGKLGVGVPCQFREPIGELDPNRMLPRLRLKNL